MFAPAWIAVWLFSVWLAPAENAPVAHAPAASAAGHAADASEVSPEQAWKRLEEGNARFVAGKAEHPNQTADRRLALASGQKPWAIILTCADSRLAPELFFDQGLGDLFVLRNAGNILDDHILGSMEYAIEHLHVGLIVVVGHEKCGAVSAAVAGGKAPGHIHSVVEAIAPAVEQVRGLPGDKVDNAVRANAQRVARILTHAEPILKPAISGGQLKVVAVRYALGSGKVEILK